MKHICSLFPQNRTLGIDCLDCSRIAGIHARINIISIELSNIAKDEERGIDHPMRKHRAKERITVLSHEIATLANADKFDNPEAWVDELEQQLNSRKEEAMNQNKLHVVLNGTDHNPYHIWGLKQNPFPQIPTYELTPSCLKLQQLGGEPIPNKEYIYKVLKGYFTEEFIELVASKFVPGKVISFTVTFPNRSSTCPGHAHAEAANRAGGSMTDEVFRLTEFALTARTVNWQNTGQRSSNTTHRQMLMNPSRRRHEITTTTWRPASEIAKAKEI